MTHRVDLTTGAARQLRKLPQEIRSRLAGPIAALADSPRPAGSKKLKGTEGYRLRVGDYRILYEIDDSTAQILIVQVGHRRDVYRGL